MLLLRMRLLEALGKEATWWILSKEPTARPQDSELIFARTQGGHCQAGELDVAQSKDSGTIEEVPMGL